MKLKITVYLVFLAFLISSDFLSSAEKKYKWDKFGVTWVISDSKAQPRFSTAARWDYTELSNYNSIITNLPISNYNSINIDAEIFEKTETPSEIMLSFAVTSESQSWYYHMYAFKITGGYWGMNKVSLIYSDRIDKTKPLNTKNNTFVKELTSENFKVKYDKIYKYHIAFEGKDVVLYINNEKVLSAPFPEKNHDGRIAISAKNVRITVDKVEIKQNDKIIFEDDFNENSILIRYVKASKESPLKDETEKKPE